MEREPTQEELDYQEDFFELLDEVSRRLHFIDYAYCSHSVRKKRDPSVLLNNYPSSTIQQTT